MKLYIVRHGQTEWNKERRIQGRADVQLNEYGRRLAIKTASGLSGIPFDICYVSPLSRAVETAKLILEGRGVTIVEDSRIIEMAFGVYEGKCCSKKGWELPKGFHLFFTDPEHYIAPRGGESFEEVKKRTGDFLRDICGDSRRKESNILVVTHGAALAGLLNNIKALPLSGYWGNGVHNNCAVTEVQALDGMLTILSENKAYYDDKIEPWGEPPEVLEDRAARDNRVN